MKRMITTDDVTGNVLSEWHGGDDQTLEPVPGRTHRTVTGADSYSGQRWNGTAFEAVTPPVVDPLDLPLTPLEQREYFARIATKTDRIA